MDQHEKQIKLDVSERAARRGFKRAARRGSDRRAAADHTTHPGIKPAASAAGVVLAAALMVLPVTACTSTSSSSSHSSYTSSSTTGSGTGSASSASTPQGAETGGGTTGTAASTDAATGANEQPPEGLADDLPYKGLSEKWIDDSWLGPAETVDENFTYQGKRATLYTWYSRNGKHESVFAAIAQGGQIVKVNKYLTSTNYWPTIFGLPDLTASGEATPKPEPFKPDPLDYSSPEDYADEAEPWFEYHGYDDPWNAAYQDWEENGLW